MIHKSSQCLTSFVLPQNDIFFNLLKENELIFQRNYDFSSLLMDNNEKSTEIINLKQLSKYAKLPE